MSAPRIEWQKLSQEELTETLNDGRRETARRLKQLRGLLLGVEPQSGPGRKAADPLERLIGELLGEDTPDAEEDAPAVTSLS